jgi:hypothetical protein
MAWVSRWKSKFVTIDYDNSDSLGVCDRTGFTFNTKDLCRQMEWRGDNLVWTGLMVGRPYLDIPNEQNRPPLVKNDPRPINDARPPTPYPDPEYPVIGTYDQTVESLENGSFFSENDPPYYVLQYSNAPTPGWKDPNPVPDPNVLLEELRKVTFQ